MTSNKYQFIDVGFIDEEDKFQIMLIPQNRTRSSKEVEVDFQIV